VRYKNENVRASQNFTRVFLLTFLPSPLLRRLISVGKGFFAGITYNLLIL